MKEIKKRKAAEATNQINQGHSTTKESQSQRILAYLQQGNSITPIDALELFGCFRLSARIADLRHLGYSIVTDKVSRNGKNFASYKLEAE